MSDKTVLIADDEKTVRLAGRIFFEGKGFKAFVAENGTEALDVVREHKPDFALLDVIMPEKDGFEVCQEIKDDKELNKTIVIIFSGNISEIERGFDYGADDCVTKPLDWNNLVGRMEELLREKNG